MSPEQSSVAAVQPGSNSVGRPGDVPARVLAVYAHPNDVDVASAGTLASWAADGATVVSVAVAQGDKGGAAPDETLGDRRSAESRAAAAVVGVAEWRSFGLLDGEVDNTVELRARLVELIREVRPEVVVTSDPTAAFLGDYVNHRDHRELGWAVLDAVSPAAASGGLLPRGGSAAPGGRGVVVGNARTQLLGRHLRHRGGQGSGRGLPHQPDRSR